jgi:hypothetical protein
MGPHIMVLKPRRSGAGLIVRWCKHLSSRLRWRSVQEDAFFRALRTARAESLLRSSKAAREDTPKLPARLQSTKKQYFSHTQLLPPLAFGSGRRVLSSAADGTS